MHLAFEQQRIDDCAEIVHDRVAQDHGDAAIRIDLDFGDMTAARESRHGRNSAPAWCRARATYRSVDSLESWRPQRRQRDRPIDRCRRCGTPRRRTRYRRQTPPEVRRDLLALFDDLERGLVQRGAADGKRTRATGQSARRAVRVCHKRGRCDRHRCRAGRRRRCL